MRIRKIESFIPNKTQAERQTQSANPIPKMVKVLIFVIVLLAPLIIWKTANFGVVRCHGIVMGQLELGLEKLSLIDVKSSVDGEILELYAEKGDRVSTESTLATIRPATATPQEIASNGIIKIKAHREMLIVDKLKKVGDTVKEGDAIYGVLPVGQYWIEAFIPEKLINHLQIGNQAVVSIPAARKKFRGKIDFISAEIETLPKMFARSFYRPTSVFRARISFLDKHIPQDILKIGMSVKCRISTR